MEDESVMAYPAWWSKRNGWLGVDALNLHGTAYFQHGDSKRTQRVFVLRQGRLGMDWNEVNELA